MRRIRRNIYEIIKRLFDIAVSAVGIILTFPIMLISCIVIYIDDPHGSPIFVQERCGKKGKIFRIYKLRTMKVNAEESLKHVLHLNEADGPAFKIEDDPRITRVGSFMRKTHLDEVPQLLNVLKGDMSLVGPRPPLPREVKRYDAWHMHKLDVKQGMTCYWQVADNRNEIPFDEWIRMDIRYIAKRSVLVDLGILIKTAGAVFKMTGK